MFNFLDNYSVRRAEYLRMSSSGLCPEKFCTTRWMENESVANQAIDISCDIVELIKLFAARAPNKQLKDNASYINLKEHYTNPFIKVYLHLFRDAAACLNGFLLTFQTDGPMVPFLSEEMGGILGWLMGFFIRKEVSKVVDTSTNVLNFKCHQHNWRIKYDVKLTTSGAEASKKSQIIYTKV